MLLCNLGPSKDDSDLPLLILFTSLIVGKWGNNHSTLRFSSAGMMLGCGCFKSFTSAVFTLLGVDVSCLKVC